MSSRDDYQRHYRQQYREQARRVNLTLSLPEHKRLSRAAERAGLPVAAFVKRLSLEALEGRSAPPEELAEQLADLDRVIRTIANNVNQMARHSHRIGHVLDEQEVFLHIAALQRELSAAVSRAAHYGPSRDEAEESS